MYCTSQVSILLQILLVCEFHQTALSRTRFGQTTGRSEAAVATQPALKHSTLSAEQQHEEQDTNPIQQIMRQPEGSGVPSEEDFAEDEPEGLRVAKMDQTTQDKLMKCDDFESDAAVLGNLRTTTTAWSTTTGSELHCTAQARPVNFVVVVSSTTPNKVESRRPVIHKLRQV